MIRVLIATDRSCNLPLKSTEAKRADGAKSVGLPPSKCDGSLAAVRVVASRKIRASLEL